MSVSDDELDRATGVIQQWYREWAQSTANDLVYDFMRGEIEDLDSFQERLDETTDSSMTYTVDQSRTLFASDSVDAAGREVEDMGGAGENAQAVLAVLTFRIDVREAMWSEFSEVEDLDPYERLVWLAENHGTELAKLGEAGGLWFIGEVDGIDFGVLVLNAEDESGTLETTRSAIHTSKDDQVVGLIVGHLQKTAGPDVQVQIDQWLMARGSR